MEGWQERLIEEKAALEGKIAALKAFIDTEDFFHKCNANERSRLHAQRAAMVEYARILGDRIASFDEPADEPEPA